MAGSSPPRHYATVNKSPAYLQLYDNNIENLETAGERCRRDWKDLVYYMKVQHRSPDLFLVQQVSDRAQLTKLIATMSKKLAGNYAGIIAKRHPKPFSSPCGAAKAHQTNAAIYRKGRFSYRDGSKVTWRSDSRHKAGCRNDALDRSINVAARLRDKITGKYVVAGSFHWPTSSFHWPTSHRKGPPCAYENAREAGARLGAGAASLRILGGDANATDTAGGGKWSLLINGERGGRLGYRDVVYSTCLGTATAWPGSGPSGTRPGAGSTSSSPARPEAATPASAASPR